MKNNLIWKIILIIGLFPFVIPFLLAYTRMSGWTLIDWLVIWSFVYWPTYVLGLVLIGFSIYKIKRLSITEHIIPFLSIVGATLLIGSFPLRTLSGYLTVDIKALVDICRIVGFIIVFVVVGLRIFKRR